MAARSMITAALLTVLSAVPGVAQDDPAQDLAVAIRDHGQPCTNPVDAERDPSDTSPDEEAWTVSCDEGRYRVKFMGDTGTEVTQIAG